MPEVEINNLKLEIDEEGFLQNVDIWNEEIANYFADKEGVEMTEEHWAVVNYIRDYYIENDLAPMVRNICKTTGFNLKKIYQLFPTGPAKGACKIAGLPKPDGCV